MAKPKSKVTDIVEEATSKYSYLKGLAGDRDARFDVCDALYELDHDTAFTWDAPKEGEPDDIRVKNPAPRKAAKHIKGLYMLHPLSIKATPIKDTMTNQALAGRIEDFLKGVLQTNRDRFGNYYDKGIAWGQTRGWCTWYVSWDPMFERDDDGSIGCPVVWKAIDPRYVYYEKGGAVEQWQSVIFGTYRRVVDIERTDIVSLKVTKEQLQARWLDDPSPHDISTEMALYLDYWWYEHDAKDKRWYVWHGIVAGSDTILRPTRMDGHKFLPYRTAFFQADPGSGMESWGLGVVYDMLEPLKNWSRVANRKMRRLTYQADNVYLSEARSRMEADAWPPDWELVKLPGTVNPVPRGWAVRGLMDVTPGEDAERLLMLFDSQINQAGLPVMSYGNLPGGDTAMSGVTFESITDAATTFLAPDTTSLSVELRLIMEQILGLCNFYCPKDKTLDAWVIEDKVARGISLARDDCKGFRIDVALDTETASDKLRKGQFGMQLKTMRPDDRPMSNRTIDEMYFGVEDWVKELELKLVEELRASPEIKQRLALAAAKKYELPGLDELIASIEKQRRAAEQQRLSTVTRQTIPGAMPGTQPIRPGMPPPTVGAMPQGIRPPQGPGPQLPPNTMPQIAGRPGMPGPGQAPPPGMVPR